MVPKYVQFEIGKIKKDLSRAQKRIFPYGIVSILKVPSGQIGSAWEWYHWKAL